MIELPADSPDTLFPCNTRTSIPSNCSSQTSATRDYVITDMTIRTNPLLAEEVNTAGVTLTFDIYLTQFPGMANR